MTIDDIWESQKIAKYFIEWLYRADVWGICKFASGFRASLSRTSAPLVRPFITSQFTISNDNKADVWEIRKMAKKNTI